MCLVAITFYEYYLYTVSSNVPIEKISCYKGSETIIYIFYIFHSYYVKTFHNVQILLMKSS